VVADGSFCNRAVLAEDWGARNVSLVARCRKDIVLCLQAQKEGRQFYSETTFTPQKVREDDAVQWKTAKIFHGGCFREVRYKEATQIYWQRGARKKPLRLLVVASVGYRISKNGRKYYRQPACLLTTDLTTPAALLLQDYFDRWGIEVNHRDEKDNLGLGQAQVWNTQSVTKVPALMVAMYSWLLLAGLQCYGPTRTQDYETLPKWRRQAKRPSCLDLITLLRRQIVEKPLNFGAATAPPTFETMVRAADA
jgi:hypothetical protein